MNVAGERIASQIPFEVVAKASAQRTIFAWASVSADEAGNPLFDLDGDHIPIEELQKAAHAFMAESRASGDMHDGEPADGVVVESFITTPEKIAAFPFLKSAPQGWLIGVKVPADVVAQIEKGDRVQMSIEGSGVREAVTKRALLKNLKVTRVDRVDVGANPKADIVLWKRAKEAPVRKDYVEVIEMPPEPKTTGELLQERDVCAEAWTLTYAFEDSLRTILASNAPDKAALIVQSLEEFLAAAQARLPGDIAKSAKTVAANESDVNATAKAARAVVAQVMKQAEESMPKPNPEPAAVDLKAIPEAQRAAVEALVARAGESAALEKRAKDAEARVTALEGENGELKKRLPEETEEERIKKALPESFRKRVEALEEKDEATTFEKRAKDEVPQIAGTTHEKLGGLLRRIEKRSTTADDAKELVRLVKAYSELAKSSPLFRELGSSGNGDGGGATTAYAEARNKAAELVTKGEAKTVEQGVALIFKRDKALYQRHLDEQKGAN